MKGMLCNNYVPFTQEHNKHREHSPNRTTLYKEISIRQCRCEKDTGTSDVFLSIKVLYNCNCISPTKLTECNRDYSLYLLVKFIATSNPVKIHYSQVM